MSVSQMELFTGLLTLSAAGLAVAVALIGVMARWSPRAAGWRQQLAPSLLGLAAVIAVVTAAGSLWFSESAGFVPCQLCWYQRIAAYPLAVILPIAAFRRDPGVRVYVLPIAFAGLAISTYHYVGEWHPEILGDTCAVDVPCSVPYFRQFGFLSLAAMAWVSFAAQAVCLAVIPWSGPRRNRLGASSASDPGSGGQAGDDF